MDLNLKEYVDESHKYYILVPLNENGEEQLYNYDFYDDKGGVNSNFKFMMFNEETFLYMEKRLLDFINVECDVLINMYEEEILEHEQLPKARQTIEKVLRNTDDKRLIEFACELEDLIDFAVENKKEVGFYF